MNIRVATRILSVPQSSGGEITAGIYVLRHDPSVEICLKGKFSSVLERDLLREYINAFFIFDVLLLAILRRM